MLTGRFNARIATDDLPGIVADFTGASPIIVENELVGRKEYAGFTRIARLKREENDLVITLEKEG